MSELHFKSGNLLPKLEFKKYNLINLSILKGDISDLCLKVCNTIGNEKNIKEININSYAVLLSPNIYSIDQIIPLDFTMSNEVSIEVVSKKEYDIIIHYDNL